MLGGREPAFAGCKGQIERGGLSEVLLDGEAVSACLARGKTKVWIMWMDDACGVAGAAVVPPRAILSVGKLKLRRETKFGCTWFLDRGLRRNDRGERDHSQDESSQGST